MDIIREDKEDGKLLIEVIFGDDKEFLAHWDKEIDDDGRVIKETGYKPYGTVAERWERKYGDDGELVWKKHFVKGFSRCKICGGIRRH